MLEMSGHVYKITNIVNGKLYVGQTKLKKSGGYVFKYKD
jgi:hypothetical protein